MKDRFEILIRQYERTIVTLMRDRCVCQVDSLTPTDTKAVEKVVSALLKCNLIEQGYYDIELWDNAQEFSIDGVILVA